ncbi:MAG: heterodisulfide reductase subunit B [Bacillota bacterium]|nr:MAG: heterodisulfide reductase subunit B [Bacillota bacterium]
MRFAYYPGCSLHSTAKEYDVSMRAVAGEVGVELVEIPDWNCCGASSAHVTDSFLGFALPARTLAQADEMGLDVLAPCAACYGRLMAAKDEARRHPDLARRFGDVTGRVFKLERRVLNVLEFLTGDGMAEAVAAGVKKGLDGLKVAPYYGCLLVRPPKVTRFDNAERPVAMDRVLEAIGASAVDFPFKTECCGASLGISRTDLVTELSARIVESAKRAGAEALAVACPLCQTNLDARQGAAAASRGESFGLPVYYITQLVGLALGVAPGKLGFSRLLVEPMTLLREKKLA